MVMNIAYQLPSTRKLKNEHKQQQKMAAPATHQNTVVWNDQMCKCQGFGMRVSRQWRYSVHMTQSCSFS